MGRLVAMPIGSMFEERPLFEGAALFEGASVYIFGVSWKNAFDRIKASAVILSALTQHIFEIYLVM